MAVRTLTFTPKTVTDLVTVDDFNALFAAIQAVIDGKIKLTNGTMDSTGGLILIDDGSIANVKSSAAGDLLGYGQ